jgi:hypothetical protein
MRVVSLSIQDQTPEKIQIGARTIDDIAAPGKACRPQTVASVSLDGVDCHTDVRTPDQRPDAPPPPRNERNAQQSDPAIFILHHNH